MQLFSVVYSVNKVKLIIVPNKNGFSSVFFTDVTFRFEKVEYFVVEDSGTIELCILQSGHSIIDLKVPAESQ